MKQAALMFALVAFTLVACPAKQTPGGSATGIVIGANFDGTPLTVGKGELAGKPIVITYFATWCPPCMAEAPEIAELKQHYGDRVVFLSLTIEPKDTPEIIAEEVPAKGLTFARASDAAWTKLMAMGGMESGTIPAHVFIKADGQVWATIIGGRGVEDAVKAILP